MSEQKHTPGEWSYSINYGPDGEQNYANVYDAAGEFVGNLRTYHAISIVRGMNAASGLLEALKGLLQQNEEFCQRTGLGDTDQMEAARAAISKALTP